MAEQPTGVAVLNRRTILEVLLDEAVHTRTAVARETGLAPATVNRQIAVLVRKGLVDEVGSDPDTGGRPSLLLKFNPASRSILALDITQDVLSVADSDLFGNLSDRDHLPVHNLGAQGKLDLLVRVVQERCAARSEESGNRPYVAVGVSVPGPVSDTGLVSLAPALDWYNQPVGDVLRDTVDAPVIVENDVNLVAYAEYWKAAVEEISALVAIGVYQGVGAGIVENGRLWRGAGGAAGQFGRILTAVSDLKSSKKGFGQVDRRLGESALLGRARDASATFSDDSTADDLFGDVARGEEPALSLFEEAMDEYAFHLANLSAIVAPDVIVFAGLFERWSDLVIPALQERLVGNVLHPPVMIRSRLKGDAKLVGAAAYALDQVGGVLSLA